MQEHQGISNRFSLQNTDNEKWPLLQLRNVTVTSQNGLELKDLFDVDVDGPFKVKGFLDPVPTKWKKAVLTPKVYSESFHIKKVFTNAMEIDDNVCIIWALGANAWYKLVSPGDAYRDIFRVMEEKVRLWMFIEAQYAKFVREDSRPKLPKLVSVSELLQKFLKQHRGDDIQTEKDVEMHIRKHHRFLLIKIFNRPVKYQYWQKTPIFGFLIQNYREIAEELVRTLSIKEPEVDRSHINFSSFQPVASIPGTTITVKREASIRSLVASRRSSLDEANPANRSSAIVNRGVTQATRSNRPHNPVTPVQQRVRMPFREQRRSRDGDRLGDFEDEVVEDYQNDEDDDEDDADLEDRRRTSSKGQSALRPSMGTQLPLDPPSPLADMNMEQERFGSVGRSKRRALEKEPKEEDNRQHFKKRCSLNIISYPSFKSTRPNGLWNCYIPFCNWKMYAANSPENQQRIHEHMQAHASKLAEAAEFVSEETEEMQYSCEHLLAKIRKMGEQK